MWREGRGSGTDATIAEDTEDHVNAREFMLLMLEANAGECCEASEDDPGTPSRICPGNSKETADATATANTEADARSLEAKEEPLANADRRVTLRDGHMFASTLRALSSASAIAVMPFATKALDLGRGDAPELIASTRDCTLRKLSRAGSLGIKFSGELKDAGDREKNGACEEEPLTYVKPAGAKRSMRLYLGSGHVTKAKCGRQRTRAARRSKGLAQTARTCGCTWE